MKEEEIEAVAEEDEPQSIEDFVEETKSDAPNFDGENRRLTIMSNLSQMNAHGMMDDFAAMRGSTLMF